MAIQIRRCTLGCLSDRTRTSQNAEIVRVRHQPEKIRETAVKHSEWEALLSVWYKVAKNAQWKHFAEIRQTWRSVDRVGTSMVFDIANNRCRLIARINYER
jgi:mRNA-degrading endonuclease HigB of HigAB toxin-antitoxin module